MAKNKKGGKLFIKKCRVALKNQSRMLTGVVRFNGLVLNKLTTYAYVGYMVFLKECIAERMLIGPFRFYDSKLAVLVSHSFKKASTTGKLIEIDVDATDRKSLNDLLPLVAASEEANKNEATMQEAGVD